MTLPTKAAISICFVSVNSTNNFKNYFRLSRYCPKTLPVLVEPWPMQEAVKVDERKLQEKLWSLQWANDISFSVAPYSKSIIFTYNIEKEFTSFSCHALPPADTAQSELKNYVYIIELLMPPKKENNVNLCSHSYSMSRYSQHCKLQTMGGRRGMQQKPNVDGGELPAKLPRLW